jgi:hypothetical protein
MEQHIRGTTDASTPAHQEDLDVAARARQIRARLPGQMVRERLDTARVMYGELHTRAELEHKVAVTLASRLGYRRTAVLEPIESYRPRIPDDALVKYDDAVRTGLFESFLVATPAYRAERQSDPWIVGEVREAGVFAVIAQWE